MSYTLWARGALQRKKRLMVNGEPRGLLLSSDGLIDHVTVDGAKHSALIPGVSSRHLIILEWDEQTNLSYILED